MRGACTARFLDYNMGYGLWGYKKKTALGHNVVRAVNSQRTGLHVRKELV